MARLTEHEQQDIIRFIEAGKSLPDKYRFLLFEDKREVELVWNGKTSEVCNVVLPFQTIEQVDEPRAEKPEDTALGLAPTGAVSTPDRAGIDGGQPVILTISDKAPKQLSRQLSDNT